MHFNTSLAIYHSQDDSPLNLANAKITLVSNDFKYTGSYISPEFIVETNDNQILREDIDYNIRFYNNIEAGEGTILIFGMHEFYGYKTCSFTIEKAMDNEIQKFIIGENGYPVGEAKYGTVKFKYSKDGINWIDELPLSGYRYFVKAYVEDNKNFNGVESQNTLEFIRPQTFDISQCQINLSFNNTKYIGSKIKPGVAVIDIYYGRDFEVRYENNIKPGIASVIIEGKGKYTGTQVKKFQNRKTWKWNFRTNLISQRTSCNC